VAVDLGVPLPVPPRPDRDIPGQSQRLRLGVLVLTHLHRFRNCMATAASQPYIAKLGFSDPDRSKDRHGLACEYLFERLLELEVAPEIFTGERKYYDNRIQRISVEHQFLRSERDANPSARSFWFSDSWNERSGELDWINTISIDELNERLHDLAALYAKLQSDLELFSHQNAVNDSQNTFVTSRCLNVPIMTGYKSSHTAGFADVLLRPVKFHGCVYGQSRDAYWTSAILGEVKITKQSAETVLQQINYYRQHIEGGVDKVYILTDYDCSDLQRLTQGSDIHVYRLGKRFEDWIASRSMPSTPEL
jgi:hypothetical protein